MKFPNLLRGVLQIARRFPSVFSFTVASPTDEVFESTTEEFGISYMVDFILFFAIDCYWIRGRWRQAIYVVPFVRAEAIHMENIMDLEGWRERQSVVHVTDCYVTVGTLSRLGIVSPIGNVALRVLVLGF